MGRLAHGSGQKLNSSCCPSHRAWDGIKSRFDGSSNYFADLPFPETMVFVSRTMKRNRNTERRLFSLAEEIERLIRPDSALVVTASIDKGKRAKWVVLACRPENEDGVLHEWGVRFLSGSLTPRLLIDQA